MKDDSVKKKIINKLQNNPIIAYACKQNGVGRSTFYRWLKEDKNFKDNIEKAKKLGENNICDAAESKILQLINNGKDETAFKASKYILNTYSKKHRESSYGYQKIKLQNKINEMEKEQDDEIQETLKLLRKIIEEERDKKDNK
jgi:predicted DNA-binding transcriptional regulator AlpA